VRTRKTLLRTFFEWATWHKLLKHDPAIGLKFTVKASTGGVRQHHWLSEQDVAQVLRSLPATDGGQRDKVALMAGFMMGLRSHEIAQLRWSHFSYDLASLTGVGKGVKAFQLGVPAQLRAELAAWRSKAPAGCDVVLPWISKNWGGIAPVWHNPLGVNGVTNIVDNAVVSSGIMFKPHDMRRTFAGILEEKGVDIKDISRLLRHSNVGVTSTYLEKNPRKTAALGHGFTLEL
jgi:integrase